MTQQRMLEGFAQYRDPALVGAQHSIIGVPMGTRLQRIVRMADGWRLWIATRDYRYGTYLDLFDDGGVLRVTVREDEGDDIMEIRPSDEAIRSMHR